MEKRKKQLYIELIILILIMTAGTVLFRLTDLDVQIQSYFYNSEEGWFLNNTAWVQTLYKYGTYPALIISIGALLIFAVGFSKVKYALYRKLTLFLVLTMIIGPGIIVNSIFKEHWGRPRPRNIIEFDGRMEYLQVLDKGVSGRGMSFPSGHASMGFYFFVLYFIYRGKNKKWAYSFFSLAVISGALIGFARIVQGGHFTSDVFWSGGFVYLTARLLYYIFKLDENLYLEEEYKLNVSKPLTIALIALAPFFIYFILLSTPYYRYRIIKIELQDSKHHNLNFTFDIGEIEIITADSVYVEYEANGFAFPGGKISFQQEFTTVNDTTNYFIRLVKKGMFNELSNSVTLYLLTSPYFKYNVNVVEGNVYLIDEVASDSLHLDVGSICPFAAKGCPLVEEVDYDCPYQR